MIGDRLHCGSGRSSREWQDLFRYDLRIVGGRYGSRNKMVNGKTNKQAILLRASLALPSSVAICQLSQSMTAHRGQCPEVGVTVGVAVRKAGGMARDVVASVGAGIVVGVAVCTAVVTAVGVVPGVGAGIVVGIAMFMEVDVAWSSLSCKPRQEHILGSAACVEVGMFISTALSSCTSHRH